MRDQEGLVAQVYPVHLGIIMDGNGRWAQEKGLPRLAGHNRGLDVLRNIVDCVHQLPIPYLSVYSFSCENWSRPVSEVTELMGLMRFFVHTDLDRLHANNIRIRLLGRQERLENDILHLIKRAENVTQENTGLTLLVAFNYGGRQEIVSAVQSIARKIRAGDLQPEQISTEIVSDHLDTAGIPDPDLIIRTSGEYRLSNFLTWQAVYAELAFVSEYWPDFNSHLLHKVLESYTKRQRRFGGLSNTENIRQIIP